MLLLRIAWLLLPMTMAVRALIDVWRDPQFDRRFRRRSLAVLFAFLAYMTVMVLILFAVMKARAGNTSGAAALSGFVIGWSAFGTLWLIRLAPSRTRPRDWLLRRWSVLDWSLLALIAVSIAIVCQQV